MQTKNSTISIDDLKKIGEFICPQSMLDEFKLGIIPSVKIDTRKLNRGDIFFPLLGKNVDGHSFIETAKDKGSLLSFASETWFREKGKLFENSLAFVVVPDVLVSMQKLAHIYRKKFDFPLIAIGGNSGKTTTKEILKKLLSEKYSVVATKENFNNHIGVPLTIFEFRSATTIGVVEMGMNHKNEMKELCEIADPTHGLITNIGHAHIEFFESLKDIAKAEGEMFDYLSSTGGVLYVNADDKNVVEVSQKCLSPLSYSLKDTSAWASLTNLSCPDSQKTRGVLKINNDKVDILFSLQGEHNAQNVLAASMVAYSQGVDLKSISNVLKDFKIDPALKRSTQEYVGTIKIINDTYNANPESMKAALKMLAEMKGGSRKIAVLGSMLELGKEATRLHREIGIFISTLNLDGVFCYGDEAEEIVSYCQMKEAFAFNNQKDLVESLSSFLEKNDVVLFKGSRGTRMEDALQYLKKNNRATELIC